MGSVNFARRKRMLEFGFVYAVIGQAFELMLERFPEGVSDLEVFRKVAIEHGCWEYFGKDRLVTEEHFSALFDALCSLKALSKRGRTYRPVASAAPLFADPSGKREEREENEDGWPLRHRKLIAEVMLYAGLKAPDDPSEVLNEAVSETEPFDWHFFRYTEDDENDERVLTDYGSNAQFPERDVLYIRLLDKGIFKTTCKDKIITKQPKRSLLKLLTIAGNAELPTEYAWIEAG